MLRVFGLRDVGEWSGRRLVGFKFHILGCRLGQSALYLVVGSFDALQTPTRAHGNCVYADLLELAGSINKVYFCFRTSGFGG